MNVLPQSFYWMVVVIGSLSMEGDGGGCEGAGRALGGVGGVGRALASGEKRAWESDL